MNIFSKSKRGEKCEYFFKSAKEEKKNKRKQLNEKEKEPKKKPRINKKGKEEIGDHYKVKALTFQQKKNFNQIFFIVKMHVGRPLVQIWVYTFTHWATAHGFSLGLIQKVGYQ